MYLTKQLTFDSEKPLWPAAQGTAADSEGLHLNSVLYFYTVIKLVSSYSSSFSNSSPDSPSSIPTVYNVKNDCSEVNYKEMLPKCMATIVKTKLILKMFL